MSRRESNAAIKAESAKEVLSQVQEPSADELTADVSEVKEPAAPEAKPVVEPAGTSAKPRGIFAPKPDKTLHRPIPSKPSFDWRLEGKTKVPNINKDKGEEITAEIERDGLKVVRTNKSRWIYLCTAGEYEKVNGVLASRAMFEEAFPHAFKS